MRRALCWASGGPGDGEWSAGLWGTGKCGPWPLRGRTKTSTDLLPFSRGETGVGVGARGRTQRVGTPAGPGSHGQQGCEMEALAWSLRLSLWDVSVLPGRGPFPLLHACAPTAPLLRVCPLVEAILPLRSKPPGHWGSGVIPKSGLCPSVLLSRSKHILSVPLSLMPNWRERESLGRSRH